MHSVVELSFQILWDFYPCCIYGVGYFGTYNCQGGQESRSCLPPLVCPTGYTFLCLLYMNVPVFVIERDVLFIHVIKKIDYSFAKCINFSCSNCRSYSCSCQNIGWSRRTSWRNVFHLPLNFYHLTFLNGVTIYPSLNSLLFHLFNSRSFMRHLQQRILDLCLPSRLSRISTSLKRREMKSRFHPMISKLLNHFFRFCFLFFFAFNCFSFACLAIDKWQVLFALYWDCS